nr:hypothetical protein [uncultured Cetobacterium sp.]
MLVEELREKLKNYPGDSEVTKELLNSILQKEKKRSPGIKYKKSEKKNKQIIKKLKELLYTNYNLQNNEIVEKLGISRRGFYRLNLNVIAKELRKEYKNQSLFK